MIKLKALAVVAVGMFAASSLFAGENGHCARQVGNDGKVSCASYANLNLTAEQKAKMDALAAECHKGGANEATMAKMDKEAQQILSKEQYASWKATHKHEKKQS